MYNSIKELETFRKTRLSGNSERDHRKQNTHSFHPLKLMKTGMTTFIAITCFTFLGAWTTKQSEDIKKAKWLVGTWENKTPKGSIYETWSKAGDNELAGKSYIIKEKDTVIFETIRLVQDRHGLFYIPTVKNQNEGLPVRFTAKRISETQLIFENPEHDFPQVIKYTRITADSLVAEIEGIKDGRDRRQVFPMKRIQ